MKLSFVRNKSNAILNWIGELRRSSYAIDRTIVLSGTGRGGTTWLAQLMSTIPGSLLLWEQLNYSTNPKSLEHGFGNPRYLPPNYFGKSESSYIGNLLKGGELGTGIRSQFYFRPWNVLFFRRYIHKFVNANMLLPWMTEMFDVKAIYIIRHPCAVVSSQLSFDSGGWNSFSKSDCDHQILFNEFPHLGDLLESLGSLEECLAFDWAIQNYVPLKLGFKGITVFYEDIVDNPMVELERIFEYLDIPIPSRILKAVAVPSETVCKTSSISGGKVDLAGWKSKLSEKQANDILSVVSKAQVNLYGLGPRPERRQLEE